MLVDIIVNFSDEKREAFFNSLVAREIRISVVMAAILGYLLALLQILIYLAVK